MDPRWLRGLAAGAFSARVNGRFESGCGFLSLSTLLVFLIDYIRQLVSILERDGASSQTDKKMINRCQLPVAWGCHGAWFIFIYLGDVVAQWVELVGLEIQWTP